MLGGAYPTGVFVPHDLGIKWFFNEFCTESRISIQRIDVLTPFMRKALVVLVKYVLMLPHLRGAIIIELVIYRGRGVVRLVFNARFAIWSFSIVSHSFVDICKELAGVWDSRVLRQMNEASWNIRDNEHERVLREDSLSFTCSYCNLLLTW